MTQNKPGAVITHTKWIGAQCFRCRQVIALEGRVTTEFERWVNATYCVSSGKMKPGHWAPVSAFDLKLQSMLSKSFAGVIA